MNEQAAAIAITAQAVELPYQPAPAVELSIRENGEWIGFARQYNPGGDWQLSNPIAERLGSAFRPNDLTPDAFRRELKRRLIATAGRESSNV